MTAEPTLERTPLADLHREAGARMVPFAGWEMPVQYRGVIDEHRAVRERAGLFDVSHMGEIRVRGPRAEAALQRLTPNDVAKLTPGRAHYSGLLTERGTYVDDLLVYRLASDDFLLVVNAANRSGDLAWVQDRIGGEVEVVDESDRWALLALQGPRAAEILAPLTDVDLGSLRYYGFARGAVDGLSGIVSRTGYTGEDGFELYLPSEAAAPVWRRLLETGADHGLEPAGLGARDTLRLEAGMALYGHEIDDTTTPWEAGLGWVVKLDSGDFVGREALARQKEKGPERKLVGFEVVGRGIARDGHGVLVGGEEAGRVTSGTWSPTLEKALGMAYLPVATSETGREIELEVRGRRLPGVVADLPFYRRPR